MQLDPLHQSIRAADAHLADVAAGQVSFDKNQIIPAVVAGLNVLSAASPNAVVKAMLDAAVVVLRAFSPVPITSVGDAL